ncbi:MAG: hypothetical protein AB1Z98_32130 [Nannocystaceae bacterium]
MKPQQIVEQLRQMADEVRVKMHLASMDAKDAWTKLEPKLHAFERRVESAANTVGDELVAAGEQLKAEVERLAKRAAGSKDDEPSTDS